MNWQVADAKNRFSELITKTLTEGPQRVLRRGEVVVMLTEADYQRLKGEQVSLKDYLLHGPDLSGLDLARDPNQMREVAW